MFMHAVCNTCILVHVKAMGTVDVQRHAVCHILDQVKAMGTVDVHTCSL